MSRARAVVFAYHDVGVRCLKTLLSAGVEVPLVVTVADDPNETQWYASVADTARGLRPEVDRARRCQHPAAASARSHELAPDFLFSFYYRAMLEAPLLAAARRGALNMHGSLLPKYRGRAPGQLGDPQGRARDAARRCTTWSSAPMPAISSTSSRCPSSRTTTRARCSPR